MILQSQTQGEGPPVALLHGLFGRARNLSGVARALASAGMRAVALDLRNHGASPHAPGMTYPALAADVSETLAGLDAAPAALLGHSMGGKTAMACALLRPGLVTRLLVADIAPVSYTHHNAAIAAALQALPLRPGLSRADASRHLEAAIPDPVIRGFLLQNLAPGDAPSWRIGLAEIAAGMADIEAWPAACAGLVFDGPVLFVSGDRSDYMTPSGRAAALSHFPRARFVTLKNAGHWLHADQPAHFARLACDFLAG